MPKKHRPRKGSLQFWPRKRAAKILPSANWKAVEQSAEKNGLLGAVCYKAGMISILVTDLTQDSRTINENIVLPATVLECPPTKVFAIRFYKAGKTLGEVRGELEKDLKRKVKLGKKGEEKKKGEKGEKAKEGKEKEISLPEGTDDVRVLLYTLPRRLGFKKRPDIVEIGIKAENPEEKLKIAKEILGREIDASEIFSEKELIDVKGVTKGKGFTGSVKRFGLGLRQHKSEKGQRRPGSLGPWTPKKVTYRAPMSGQFGFFTRLQTNNQILYSGKAEDSEKINPKGGFMNYGLVKSSFIVVRGSFQGAKKRALLITYPLRKKRKINDFKFLRVVK